MSREADLLRAIEQGDLQQVRRLLKAGAEPGHQRDADGLSGLMLAAGRGDTALVSELLAAGAPWNALDRRGCCAGEYAEAAGEQATFDQLVQAGVQAELILGAVERQETRLGRPAAGPDTYLEQRLHGDLERLMDEQSRAVMMAWEGPLMQAHAHAICQEGADVLNIGFGMGLVDSALQSRQPRSHTIVEAHPDVILKMKAAGWHCKPGVRIVEGRWQDCLPDLQAYDGIFFDTFGEDYADLRDFHSHLPKLLRREGVYSFFNGLAADNPFFHAVCLQLVASELHALQGLTTQYIQLPINLDQQVWQGVSNPYWKLSHYSLPLVYWEDAAQKSDRGVSASQ